MNFSEVEFKRIISEVLDEKLEPFFNKLTGKANKKNKENDSMTVIEVCNYFNVSKVTINNWIKNGKIYSFKIGNRRLFNRNYIELFKVGMKRSYGENLPDRSNEFHPHHSMNLEIIKGKLY